MRFEEIYKSHRSAFIDGVFVGVALTIAGKYIAKKFVEQLDKNKDLETPIAD